MEIKSYRGKKVDMNALLMRHEKDIALGNASMNTRGDIVGRGGKVVKKREDLIREYHENDPKAVKKVSIHADPKADKKAAAELIEMSKPVVKSKKTEKITNEIDPEVLEATEADDPIDFS